MTEHHLKRFSFDPGRIPGTPPFWKQTTMSDPTPPSAPALELSHIAKAFGAVIALTNGTLRLHRDTIHALVGENGAGKSTLVKIIAGLYQRDAGDLLLDGEVVDFRSTA